MPQELVYTFIFTHPHNLTFINLFGRVACDTTHYVHFSETIGIYVMHIEVKMTYPVAIPPLLAAAIGSVVICQSGWWEVEISYDYGGIRIW